jgi:hypothetical protein
VVLEQPVRGMVSAGLAEQLSVVNRFWLLSISAG